MSIFIIRNQGFFFTDEYNTPTTVFKQVFKQTFSTRAAAEKALATLVRKWARSGAIGDYVLDDRPATEAIWKYLRAEWPETFESKKWLFDAKIPTDATDAQVDEIVKRMAVTFAQVFEVESGHEDDDDVGVDDEIYYGPTDDDESDDEESDEDESDEDESDDDDGEDPEVPPQYREGEPVPEGYAVAVNPFTTMKMLVRRTIPK